MTFFRGVYILCPNFRGGQGFVAFGRDFEMPPPPQGVFDTFPKSSMCILKLSVVL